MIKKNENDLGRREGDDTCNQALNTYLFKANKGNLRARKIVGKMFGTEA